MSIKKSPLGVDPLSQGIFTKTVPEKVFDPAPIPKTKPKVAANITEATKKKPVSVKQKPEYGFLQDTEREKITLQIPVELNDWLDGLVRKSKRKFGHKVPKQIWVQAGIELLRSSSINLEAIDSEDALRAELQKVSAKIRK